MSWADIGKGIGSIFSGAAKWVTPVNTGLEIIDQLVEDKDKAAELKFKAAELHSNVYIQELKTQTIPLVDAVHKMGRQMMNWAQMSFYFYCIKNGVDVTPELVAGVSGAAITYNAVKGKGR